MKRHQLYEIDLNSRPAFCVVRGYTEICIPSPRMHTKPKPMCVASAREEKASALSVPALGVKAIHWLNLIKYSSKSCYF